MGGAQNIHHDPYLNGTTVPFDNCFSQCVYMCAQEDLPTQNVLSRCPLAGTIMLHYIKRLCFRADLVGVETGLASLT